MILNIGYDNYIFTKDIVVILNASVVSKDKDFIEFLKDIRLNKCFFGREDESIKSYIITNKKGVTKVYTSIISSKTLYKRTTDKNGGRIYGQI